MISAQFLRQTEYQNFYCVVFLLTLVKVIKRNETTQGVNISTLFLNTKHLLM